MKKIYSKFTNDRKREFQIQTSMYIDGGKKRVVKRAVNNEGKAHIANIVAYYEQSNCDLLCRSALIDDQTVEFDFIEGATLTEILLKAIREDDKKGFENIIDEYKAIITNVFANGKSYNEIINSTVKNANIDLSFDNIIKGSEGYKIIDYEWIIDDVEILFIVYRAVYALVVKYGSSINKIMSISEFYQMFSINSENIRKYELMNQELMNYICGAEESYKNILNRYEKRKLNIDRNVIIPEKYTRIYYKRDGAYSDEISDRIILNQEKQHIRFDIKNLDNVEELRIDPSDDYCICEDIKIVVTKTEGTSNVIQFRTNGIRLYDDRYLFLKEDPQIILAGHVLNGAKNISVDFIVNTNYDEMIHHINYVLNKMDEEKTRQLEDAERNIIKHQKALAENENRNANLIHELKIEYQECMHDKELFKEMSRQLQKRLREVSSENKTMKAKAHNIL